MTNDKQSGASKLVSRILEDANADARAAAEEAARAVDALRLESEAAVKQKRAAYEKKRQSATQAVLDGCRTRASIEGRKATLTKKREIIENVFSSAYDTLLALDGQQRGEVCRRMLLAEAEGGETVLPASADREAVAECLRQCGLPGMKLGEKDAPYDGGFLLVGDGYEKECSFASLMRELRDAEETTVAGLLFN